MMRTRQPGFTLVEALVALGLFALTAMLGYRGLGAILDGRNHLQAHDRHWRQLEQAFILLRADLGQAVDRPARDVYGVAEEGLRGDLDSGGTLDAPLSLTRLGVSGADGLAAAPQRVGWRLREDRLERLAWDHPDRGPRSTPTVLVVLDHVQAFSLRYLGPAGPAQSFDTRWRAPNHVGLPRAVEVHLTLQDGTDFVRLFDLPGGT